MSVFVPEICWNCRNFHHLFPSVGLRLKRRRKRGLSNDSNDGSEANVPLFSRRNAAWVRKIDLDIIWQGWYTCSVRNPKIEFSFFCRTAQLLSTGGKTESRSMDGSERDREHTAPKGNAKTLRQKDRIRTTLRKVRHRRTPKGQPGALRGRESLRSGRRQRDQRGLFVSFSFAPPPPPLLYAAASAPST